ncbi:DegT/DnrJ/EryC1/StrS family aminotransferase [Candidatus Neomarinimicrobiota bacterium]
MKFIDLKTQYARIEHGVHTRIQAVLEHGQYILGPEVRELEAILAEYTGASHCVSCSSGTDALLMTLMGWGIGPGDAVFTTPFTFMATAESIALLGATPVFVDIDPDTLNIDPAQLPEAIEKVKNEGRFTPKVILPVDIFGLPVDHDRTAAIARQYGLLVFDDAAQAFGASIDGRRTGNFGDATAVSFFPAKPLGAYGDGGAIFTNDGELAARLESIRMHGQGGDRYSNVRLGLNGRLDTLQAAILLEKMTLFDEEIELRQEVADGYARRLATKVAVPRVPAGYRSVWAQYCPLAASAEEREAILARLNEADIPSAVYYRIPLHLQEAFQSLGYRRGSMPITEDVCNRVFALPMHPYLDDAQLDEIARVLQD